MRERCAWLMKNPQHVGLQIAGAVLLASCGIWFTWHQSSDSTWRLVGIVLSLGAGYLFRNIVALVLGRSWFGFPAVLLGLSVRNFIDVDAGNIVVVAALALWVWPVWPFVVLLLLIFVALAPALTAMCTAVSKASGHKLYGGK